MTTPIQADLGPRNPPNNVGEDPFLIWIGYGLGNLLYAAGTKFGPEILDQIIPWMDGLVFVVQGAVREAKSRLRDERPMHVPVGFRLDTTGLAARPNDEPPT